MSSPVRTRFAVSPTGYMHVGGVRNALFDWLVARQAGGTFILRIDDTDQVREVAGAQQHVLDTLQQLGLNWQEGPDRGGPHAPYIQSQRLDLYKEWGQKLITAGRAYADPYTPAEVQALREQAQAAKQPFLYRNHRPSQPPQWDGNQPLRFKSDPKVHRWQDLVMGDLSAGEEAVDDFILIKSDGFPTYNFCNIVDDYEMNISHVIRSQEFLASMPKYLNLYEALGITPPQFATLPYIMGPDGKKKLSKRDGAKDALDYLRDGYLPEALLNFLATLGWNDGTEQEVFTIDELIAKFSLERVQRSGAKFDEQRLLWLNGAHIRQLSLDELYRRVTDFWPPAATDFEASYKKAVLGLVQERLKFFKEITELTSFFFVEPQPDLSLIDTNKKLSKLSRAEQSSLLRTALESLNQSDFSVIDLQQRLNDLLQATGQQPAILFSLIRIATTWAAASPSLAESLQVLGKDRVLARIKKALGVLKG
jgi:glutamyl-tRNA synthetase